MSSTFCILDQHACNLRWYSMACCINMLLVSFVDVTHQNLSCVYVSYTVVLCLGTHSPDLAYK